MPSARLCLNTLVCRARCRSCSSGIDPDAFAYAAFRRAWADHDDGSNQLPIHRPPGTTPSRGQPRFECLNGFSGGSDPLQRSDHRRNGIIQDLVSHDGIDVDNAMPFLGNEVACTYQAALPAGFSVSGPYGGVLPIGNVHPNALGYQVIADDMATATPSAVPEPATWTVLAAGLGLLGLMTGRRWVCVMADGTR